MNTMEVTEKMEVFFLQTLAVLYKALWYVNANCIQDMKSYLQFV